MLIRQMFQVGTDRGAVQDHRDAKTDKNHRRHAEEADVERADPEVEQVAADERPTPHTVLALKIQHRHGSASRRVLIIPVRGMNCVRVRVVSGRVKRARPRSSGSDDPHPMSVTTND